MEIFDEKGMVNRFDKNMQKFLREIDKLNKQKCKVFMCLAVMRILLHEADKYLGNEFEIKDNTGLLNLLQTEPISGFCKHDKEQVNGVVYYDLAGGNLTVHMTPDVDHESQFETSGGDGDGNGSEMSGSANNTSASTAEDSGSDESGQQYTNMHGKDEPTVDHESHFESANVNTDEHNSNMNETKIVSTNRIGEYVVGGGGESDANGTVPFSNGMGEYDVGGDNSDNSDNNDNNLVAGGRGNILTHGLGEYDVGGSNMDTTTTSAGLDKGAKNETNANETSSGGSSSGGVFEVSSKDDGKQSGSDGIDQYLEEHRASHEHEITEDKEKGAAGVSDGKVTPVLQTNTVDMHIEKDNILHDLVQKFIPSYESEFKFAESRTNLCEQQGHKLNLLLRIVESLRNEIATKDHNSQSEGYHSGFSNMPTSIVNVQQYSSNVNDTQRRTQRLTPENLSNLSNSEASSNDKYIVKITSANKMILAKTSEYLANYMETNMATLHDDNLYPVPDYNETININDIRSIRDIFPTFDAIKNIVGTSTLSSSSKSSASSSVNERIFQDAIKYLNEIGYKIVYGDHNNTSTYYTSTEKVMKIKLLEYNLAHLLALYRNSDINQVKISAELLHFFETYLKVLQFAEAEMGKIHFVNSGYTSDINSANYEFSGFNGNDSSPMENPKIINAKLSQIQMVKTINLTDYLTYALNSSSIPEHMHDDLSKLYDFLLEDMKNDRIKDFFPTTHEKIGFIRELFHYLLEKNLVDEREKGLLRTFLPFIKK